MHTIEDKEGAIMQERDFDWFVKNHEALFKQYGHCYMAIRDEHVLGTYPTYGTAVRETKKTFPLGSFIVQECTKDTSGYTNYIMSPRFSQI